MKISAYLENGPNGHVVSVKTNDAEIPLSILAKDAGRGSAVNGGEMLCAALATCYCNDIFREAAKRGIAVGSVRVEVEAEFGGEGEAARSISYLAVVEADASDGEIRDLIGHTDKVAEVHNTLRQGVNVTLRNK